MSAIQGWDETSKHADSMGRFLRLKSGEKVIVAFCGAPCAIDRVFVDERYATYDAKLHGGAKRSPRFFLNVFDVAQGAMKIMEGGKPWYEAVCAVRKKYGLEKYLYEVSRTGEGLQTKYAVMYHQDLPAALGASIAQLPLHDLEKAIAEDDAAPPEEGRPAAPPPAASRAPAPPPASVATPTAPSPPVPSEPTIDDATADALRKAIALLPPALKQAFKQTFGVQRLNDLLVSQLDAVRAWLDAQAEL